MGRKFTVAAQLDGVTPLKDGGLSMRFHTQEMTKAEMAYAMEYYQSHGHLLFSENDIGLSDVPKGNAYLDNGKSPSKRLRDRMFVFYKKRQIGDMENFDKWYERQLEQVGQQYLERLDK